MNRPGPDPAPLSENLGEMFSFQMGSEAGVSRKRSRAKDLLQPYWGLRTTKETIELEDRCRLLQLRMPPESFFSHSTAALLHGVPVPYRLATAVLIQITTPAPARAPHAAGLRGHRLTIEADDVTEISGIRVSTQPRTWCDLASQVQLPDLVAAGDFIIRRSQDQFRVEHLDAARKRQRSPRGRSLLVRAVPLLDTRSESPQESILRVLLVEAGFTNILVNHENYTLAGEFVARTDLLLADYNLVLEYQGDYHRKSKTQYRADMTR